MWDSLWIEGRLATTPAKCVSRLTSLPLSKHSNEIEQAAREQICHLRPQNLEQHPRTEGFIFLVDAQGYLYSSIGTSRNIISQNARLCIEPLSGISNTWNSRHIICTIFSFSCKALDGLTFQAFFLAIYRLTLHPLAKYPGPFLAKITPWYDVYHGYLKDRHLDQYKCQLKYGNVFRYGPNSLVIQTSGGLRDIYASAKKNAVRKSDSHQFLHLNGVASIVFATDKSVHAFKRRVLSQAFSEQSIRSLEPFIISNVDRWLVELERSVTEENKGWSPPKNMAKHATYLAMDIVGDLCFGKPFGAIESESARGLADVTSSRLAQWYQVSKSYIIDLDQDSLCC